jgi:outer membrane protein OmpA-like peptidoglycan-associated protein
MRRLRLCLATSVATVLPGLAFAQPVAGFYLAAGAGVNFLPNTLDSETINIGPIPSLPGLPNGIAGQSYREPFRTSFDFGAVGVASVGYGLGNGLRIEAEADYRYNKASYGAGSSPLVREQKFGGMANLLYDFDVALPVYPYLGAGAGYMHTDRPFNETSNGSFAYQAIAGVALAIAGVPGLSVTAEYRFMGLAESTSSQSFPVFPPYVPSSSLTQKYSGDYNHSILLGVRYAFNTPAPPPVAAPIPPASMPTLARTYLVFFDWDRADLTDRARQIIADAAQASTRVPTTRIEVQGNADRSGTPAYNQRLSLRRAETVAAELVRHGVPQSEIQIEAFGDTRPLVATAPGVREPQNRRVAIILR